MFQVLVFGAIATAVVAYDNGLGATPPMGWSTWCTNDLCGIPDRCSEYEIRNKADAMVEQGLVDLGYKWILLDDCWAHTERDANGNLQPSPKLFPSGMPALVDYVHSKGMYIGLYTCVGTETCKKGRPGSYGHYQQDADNFAAWKLDMVKADNCHKPSNESQVELYTQLSQALNNTGHPMIFAMCNWGEEDVSSWGPGVSQMFRIQMDHIPFWQWPPKGQGVGYGQGTKEIIDFMADLHPSKTNKPYQWMDPDFLETLFEPIDIYSTMNYTNSRTEFAFWSLWSSPLLVATDPANLSEEKKSILMNTEVLEIHHDSLWIAGERVRNDTNGGQVWQRPLSNGDIAVILYNSGNFKEINVEVNFSEIGWSLEESVSIRDLWAKTELGKFVGAYKSPAIPVHDHYMLRLSRTTDKA